jgi:hypothetical protein
MEANIQRYTLAANEPLAVEVDFNYFLIKSDTYILLDPPNLLATANLWFELDTATSGVVEILRC